ncbi:MAG: alkaline phosphatase [Gammaproteobacteria bacterium]|nr:alkaline phosphatase [Gammaproteobacteria bacterium]
MDQTKSSQTKPALKRSLGICCIAILITLAACSRSDKVQQASSEEPVKQVEQLPVSTIEHPDDWYAQGQSLLQEKLQQPLNQRPAKNVILFIGDGLSVATVTAARILDGQLRGESGEENFLSFEHFPYTGLSKTYNTDSQTPDSAGTATAMLSGIKTKISVVGMNDKVVRGECAGSQAAIAPSLLELAEQAGYKTGVIATTRITHATPASAFAHVAHRDWEAQAPQGCKDIASQLVDFDKGDGIEVVLGGGRAAFLPVSTPDPEYADKSGYRRDGKNLIQTWQAQTPSRKYVWNLQDFNALALSKHAYSQILGLFEPSHMQYEADRGEDASGEPSIADMTGFAIKHLSSEDGFFLLVEGGRIDHAHHAANAYRALHDAVAFADAVKMADELTNDEDTLIVVTADHGHVMEFAGYPKRGNPILGKVSSALTVDGMTLDRDASGKPYTTLGYLNGPGHIGASDTQPEGSKSYPHYPNTIQGITNGRPDLSEVDTEDKNYLQESGIPTRSETHSGTDVGVYAKGPAAHLLTGVYEQNYIFHVMQHALRLEPAE